MRRLVGPRPSMGRSGSGVINVFFNYRKSASVPHGVFYSNEVNADRTGFLFNGHLLKFLPTTCVWFESVYSVVVAFHLCNI